jgi:hypothetical protein
MHGSPKTKLVSGMALQTDANLVLVMGRSSFASETFPEIWGMSFLADPGSTVNISRVMKATC